MYCILRAASPSKIAPGDFVEQDPNAECPPANTKEPTFVGSFVLAGGQGFEPWLAESESAVLPLDDPPNLPKILPSPTPICGQGWIRGYAAHPAGRNATRFCLSVHYVHLGANLGWRSQSPQSYR